MIRVRDIIMPLDHPPDALKAAVAARLGVEESGIVSLTIHRRGADARRRQRIQLVYTVDVDVADEAAVLARGIEAAHGVTPSPDMQYRLIAHAAEGETRRPVVIGTGPCGLMAGLTLAQMGFRPIILERGRIVRERTKDTWGFWRRAELKPESNVQFGEGGAGTFSDGKLYSGIKDPRYLGRRVLETFVKAGAPDEILYVAKPHIGTFRLVTIVDGIREEVLRLGGEYRFGCKVTDLDIATRPNGTRHVTGVRLDDGTVIDAQHVVLAVGHSARDTFAALHQRGIYMEAKPFSIGVRIEHPQSLIDACRYGTAAKHPLLGAADYKLVHHASNGRSVYSFCRCPGGTVVAAASEPGRLVTNGMSQYSRAERNANAGLVVGITPEKDYPGGPLAGIDFQRRYEELAFIAGGSNYFAPAQRVGDFLAGRPSTALASVVPSYKPGVTPTDLSRCLPDFAVTALREALSAFDRDIPGYLLSDAVMTGVETRTSSPLRITRDATFQSIGTHGLFPAGEGAGYAGGILSAGVDGIRIAEAVAAAMTGVALPSGDRTSFAEIY